MVRHDIDFDPAKIGTFCRKWKVREFSLFGSILRDDYGPDSDVDVLVELEPGAPWSLFEWVDMINELKALFGRPVDLVDKSALRNPYRRERIMSSREVLYAA